MPDRRRAGAAFALLLAIVAPSSVNAQRAEPAALSCADAALPAAILAGPATLAPLKTLKTVSLDAPRARLTLAVADTSSTREIGLMCVTHLRPHAGMIFVFSQSGKWEFWMKNTLESLDMIWVGADGTVTNIAANVPPSTLETSDEDVARRSGDGLYVIELSAGEAASDGIVKGLKLRLPAHGIQ
jgi:uncharacterized membrane protein (UPF0127 family)